MRAAYAAKSRFSLPLCPIRGKVPFLSCSCSAFRKGKKCITSDALFADLWQPSDLPYRKPAFLSPPVLRTTSPYHKGRFLYLAPLCRGSWRQSRLRDCLQDFRFVLSETAPHFSRLQPPIWQNGRNAVPHPARRIRKNYSAQFFLRISRFSRISLGSLSPKLSS